MYVTVVFDISWDDCNIQKKLKAMVIQNFWRRGARCSMVCVKIVDA